MVEPEQPGADGHRQFECAVTCLHPVVDDERRRHHQAAGYAGCEPDQSQPTCARRLSVGQVQVRNVLAQPVQELSMRFHRAITSSKGVWSPFPFTATVAKQQLLLLKSS